jgi:hypothetical protein
MNDLAGVSPVLVTGRKWGMRYGLLVDGVNCSVSVYMKWRMSAAPHQQRKDLKLCSHTLRPGQKPGFFVFAFDSPRAVGYLLAGYVHHPRRHRFGRPL